MKLKKLWIPMLILTLIGGGIKICDTIFNVYGDGFFFNSMICNTIFVSSAILLMIIGWVLSIIDRKKVFNVKPSKNIFCGLFGFIASVSIIGGGILSLISDSPNIVQCILALVGGGILLFESCVSFTGQNGMAKVPVLALLVPIWCCSRFLSLFVEYTHKSVAATEMFDIVAVAALLIFLFYQSMFFAELNNTTAVRKSTVYGMVYILLGLTVAIDLFIKMFMPTNIIVGVDSQIVEPTIPNILASTGDIALCIYAFLFTRTNIRTADDTAVEKEPDDNSSDEAPPTAQPSVQPENVTPVTAVPVTEENADKK